MKRASGTRSSSGRRKRTRSQQHGDLLRKARKEGVYDALLALQDGRCGICGRTQEECCTNRKTGVMRRFDMDHDHRTMEIRGLLCRGCNIKLKRGYTTEWLGSAYSYSKNPPAQRLLKGV